MHCDFFKHLMHRAYREKKTLEFMHYVFIWQ